MTLFPLLAAISGGWSTASRSSGAFCYWNRRMHSLRIMRTKKPAPSEARPQASRPWAPLLRLVSLVQRPLRSAHSQHGGGQRRRQGGAQRGGGGELTYTDEKSGES
jgi:hypothetical protein